MPRPARSRVAPAATKAKAASPQKAVPAPENAVAERVKGGEAVSDTSSDIYGVSDREIERQAARKSFGAATTTTKMTRVTTTKTIRSRRSMALADSRSQRDAAMSRLNDLSSTSAIDAPSTGTLGTSSATLRGRRRGGADASGIDMVDDSELFGTDLDHLVNVSLGEDSELDAGQQSTDTSSFNIGVFRRGRPRQSSIVGREDAPIRPSSRGPNTPSISATFNIGAFKRRAREQSILGSRRRIPADQTDSEVPPRDDKETTDGSDLESDLEASRADAQSPSRRRTRGSNVRERQPSLPAVETSVERGSSRKRKSADGQDSASKRPALESANLPQESIESDSELSLPALDNSPSTPRRSTPPRAPDVLGDDEIMAPPASSSSSGGSPTFWPSMHNIPRSRHGRVPSHSRKTPAPADGEEAMSDMSSPPSLTHSPNYTSTKSRNTRTAAKKEKEAHHTPDLTTAQLTSLLPKRRHRPTRDDHSDEDLDSTLIAAAGGEDELSYVAGPRARRARKQPARPPAETDAPTVGRAHGAAAAKGPGRKGARRTYGSRAGLGSDKENQGDGQGDTIEVADDEDYDEAQALPDDTFDSTSDDAAALVQHSEELQQAARKFKEVDRWQMEFEEVTEESSPGVSAR